MDAIPLRRRRISPDGWAGLAIVAAVVLVNAPYLLGVVDANPLGPRSQLVQSMTAPIWPGQPTIDPNVGFISQAISHRAMLDLLHFHWPWWDPYEGTGMPLLGDMQSAALFPFTVFTLLSGGQLYEHILLEILAGFSTYWLMRRLAVGRAGSLVAAIAFALNGTFAWFAHATVNPIAFLPLLLLGLERAYSATREGRAGGWGLMAVAGGLSVYAGFPEVAYLDALLALGWFLWRGAGLDWAARRTFARKALAATLTGLLLTAPLLIAMVGYFNHADLWLHTHGYLGHVHLPPQTMPQLVLPYVFGPIFAFSDPKLIVYVNWVNVGGFLSASLLVLGLLGLAGRGRGGLRILLAGWIAVMLARTYGTPSALGDVVNVFPGLSNSAVFRYAPASVELAAAILAGLGVDALVAAPARRRIVAVGVVATLILVVAAVSAHRLTRELGPVYSGHAYFSRSVIWALAVVAGVVIVAMVRDPRIRASAVGAVAIADAMLLFGVPELSAPRAVRVDTTPVAYLQHHLGTGRYFTLGPLAPNYGSYYGLASINANDVPVPSAYAGFVTSRLDPYVSPTAFVGMLGGGRPFGAPSPATELLRNLGGYREAGVDYVLTSAGQALPQTQSGLALVLRTPTTWIYHLAGAAPYMTATGGGCTVAADGRTTARTACRGTGVLVRRETDMPGWSATVDGHTVPIRAADGVFQSITLPSGRHTVRFSYGPPDIGWGGLALLAGCLGLGIAWRARRRSRSSAVVGSG